MGQSVVGRWPVEGGLQFVNARDLQLEYLLLCMVVRQFYGRRRRDLELGHHS